MSRKKGQRYYSFFITLANVCRFSNSFTFGLSKKFALNPCHVPTTHYICSYTTLWNLKCHFYYFIATAVTKTNIEIHFFHIISHVLPYHASDSTATVCHVRDLLRLRNLPAKQRVSSVSVSALIIFYISHLSFVWLRSEDVAVKNDYNFIANSLLNQKMKEFLKSANI